MLPDMDKQFDDSIAWCYVQPEQDIGQPFFAVLSALPGNLSAIFFERSFEKGFHNCKAVEDGIGNCRPEECDPATGGPGW